MGKVASKDQEFLQQMPQMSQICKDVLRELKFAWRVFDRLNK
jgi:hypothetical protein